MSSSISEPLSSFCLVSATHFRSFQTGMSSSFATPAIVLPGVFASRTAFSWYSEWKITDRFFLDMMVLPIVVPGASLVHSAVYRLGYMPNNPGSRELLRNIVKSLRKTRQEAVLANDIASIFVQRALHQSPRRSPWLLRRCAGTNHRIGPGCATSSASGLRGAGCSARDTEPIAGAEGSPARALVLVQLLPQIIERVPAAGAETVVGLKARWARHACVFAQTQLVQVPPGTSVVTPSEVAAYEDSRTARSYSANGTVRMEAERVKAPLNWDRPLMARILVIEDDPLVLETIEGWLAFENHVVTVAADGTEGWDHLQKNEYDIVLLDWDLPGVTGLEILQRLRRAGNQTWVIMLTGHIAVDDKESGLDAGADDYMTKPFHIKELNARIRVALRAQAPAASSQAPLGRGNEAVLRHADLAGTTLAANWEFLELIGEGATAVVFKARHPRSERLAAIKVLLATALKRTAIKRF